MKTNQALWASYFPEFVKQRDKGLALLMDASHLVSFSAHQQLFYVGAPCSNYMLVLTGTVKVQIMSETGREVLLYHVNSGDSCVLTTSCLLSGDSYPAEGIAETEVLAFAIPHHAFHRCVELSPLFREFVFKNFSARLSKLIGRMEAVVFETIDQRICKALLVANEPVMFKTHQELAYELGTAREVVSRHLKQFEHQGWISLKRGTIDILNRAALSKFCQKSN